MDRPFGKFHVIDTASDLGSYQHYFHISRKERQYKLDHIALCVYIKGTQGVIHKGVWMIASHIRARENRKSIVVPSVSSWLL